MALQLFSHTITTCLCNENPIFLVYIASLLPGLFWEYGHTVRFKAGLSLDTKLHSINSVGAACCSDFRACKALLRKHLITTGKSSSYCPFIAFQNIDPRSIKLWKVPAPKREHTSEIGREDVYSLVLVFSCLPASGRLLRKPLVTPTSQTQWAKLFRSSIPPPEHWPPRWRPAPGTLR